MTAKVLIIALAISSIAGVSINAVRIAKELPLVRSQEVPGGKFARLTPLIAGETEVGFFTYQSPQDYIKELYQAQYTLAPIIVRETTEPRFVVVSNLNADSVEKLRANLGATIIASFPDVSLYLLQK